MKYIAAVLVGLVLAGCTTKSIINGAIQRGTFSFSRATSSDYDFDVKLERVRDINWDVANKDDRLMIIKQMLGSVCPNPKIIDEEFISRGTTWGFKAGSYLIKVSCPK
ncbi:hypothetical protein CI610_00318 [invertebrate metagenome]|uniref:Lipoprotein n=1 Tax=invertebrate metagenome TaxID=1711999 RepID=A0A2H9TBT1_9ZZZZ